MSKKSSKEKVSRFKRFFFSKKYFDLPLNERIKQVERDSIIALLGFIFLAVVCLWIIYMAYGSELFSREYKTQFIFGNLTEAEKEKAVHILSEINPDILFGAKKIVVEHNITKDLPFTSKYFDKDKDSIQGFNQNGVIYVNYFEYEPYMREVLCHELLHNLIQNSKIGHKIIYELGAKQVCFSDYG